MRLKDYFTIWGVITFATLILVGFMFWFVSWWADKIL